MANAPLGSVLRHIRKLAGAMAILPWKTATTLRMVVCLAAGGVGLAHHAGSTQQAVASELPKTTPSAARKPAQEEEKVRTDRHGDPLPGGALARIGTIRLRHRATVKAVSYSPDGKVLAAIAIDGVRLWDAATGKELHSYDRSPFYDGGFFSSDGRRLWLQSSGAWQNSPGMEIYFWNLTPTPERQPRKAPFEGSKLRLLAPSPDGKFLAIGENNLVRLCNIASGVESRRFKDHVGEVMGARYSVDGKVLASFDGRTVILWNVQTGEPIRTFHAANREKPFRNIALAPDGKMVAALSREPGMPIHLWDIATGKEVRKLLASDRASRELMFSPDGKVLISAGQRLLRAWDVSSGKMLWEQSGYGDPFFCVAFAPDSKTLAVGLRWGVHQYDVATGKERPPVIDRERITFLALLGDGRTVASAASGKPLRLWRLPHAEEVPPAPGRKRPAVPEVADISLDGKWLASRGHKDGAIRIWDIASAAEVRRFPFIKSPACSFSPDGRWLQTHDYAQNPNSGKFEHELRFWDARTGKMVSELRGQRASMPVFSPDSRLYATQGPDRGVCCLGSVPNGSLVRTIAVPTGPCRFSFSADGRLLVGASLREISPRLWEVVSGKEITTLSGKAKDRSGLGWPGVNEAAFSPDGRRLIAGDLYGNLFCWDVEGRLLRQWKGDNFPVRVLSFTPDGKLLITGGDTTALVWKMDEVLPPEERRRTTLAAAELNALWSDLKEEDATRAYRAIWKLAAAPDQAIPFLRERLRPAREPNKTNAERIVQLVGDLDNNAFTVREIANRELARFGREAEPALRKALASDPSAESKRRIEELLRKLPESLPSPPPEQLRQLRALAVLEYAATPETKECLRMLAKGVAEVRLTCEAKAALERLLKR